MWPKLDKIIKVMITVFCLIVLCYQTNDILSEYMSGKTYVTMNLRSHGMDSIPAVTICLANWISLDKVAKIDPQFNEQYQTYLNKWDNFTLNRTSQADFYPEMLKSCEKDHLNCQVHLSMSNFKLFLPNLNWSYARLDDLAITMEEGLFEVDLVGADIHHGQIVPKWKTFRGDEVNPVESYCGLYKQLVKCFTFFSALKHNWRNYQAYLNVARVRVKPIPRKMSTIEFDIYGAVHSPNTFPFCNEFGLTYLSPTQNHMFQYSQLNTELLGNGYDTNCYQYDLDHRFANFNMRSDCITSCYKNLVEKTCKVDGLMPNPYPIRVELIKLNPQSTYKRGHNCIESNSEKFRAECEELCLKDCHFHQYLTEAEFLLSEYESHKYESTGTEHIWIIRNEFPDIIIKHIPQLTFISLVCNFGGLVGMWLGISILATFKDSFQLITLIVKNRHACLMRFKNFNCYSKIKKDEPGKQIRILGDVQGEVYTLSHGVLTVSFRKKDKMDESHESRSGHYIARCFQKNNELSTII